MTPHYDPALVQQFTSTTQMTTSCGSAWDQLDLPVLCLRGEDSTLLTAETAQAMRERGPRAAVALIPGCGHGTAP